MGSHVTRSHLSNSHEGENNFGASGYCMDDASSALPCISAIKLGKAPTGGERGVAGVWRSPLSVALELLVTSKRTQSPFSKE